MRIHTGLALILFLLLPDAALAHAAEQGFVLLLPTDIYIGAGVTAVALTLVLLAFLPGWVAARLFRPVGIIRRPRGIGLHHVTSCLAAVLLWGLVWRGFTGAHDPTVNPLPLFIWTLWWVGLVTLQGLLGDL